MTNRTDRELQRGPNTVTADEAAAALPEHGHIIIEKLVTRETMQQLLSEMQPHMDVTPYGEEGTGFRPSGRAG